MPGGSVVTCSGVRDDGASAVSRGAGSWPADMWLAAELRHAFARRSRSAVWGEVHGRIAKAFLDTAPISS